MAKNEIYVQAIYHRAAKHRASINKFLREKGWREHKLSDTPDIWKGDSTSLNCSDKKELEYKAEKDFFVCSMMHGVPVTLMYQVYIKEQ